MSCEKMPIRKDKLGMYTFRDKRYVDTIILIHLFKIKKLTLSIGSRLMNVFCHMINQIIRSTKSEMKQNKMQSQRFHEVEY